MFSLVVLVCLLLVWAWLSADVTGRLAEQKGRPHAEGYWLGILFGGFGLLVEALLPSS